MRYMKHPPLALWVMAIALFAALIGCHPVHAQDTNAPAASGTFSPQEISLIQQFYDKTLGTSNGVFVVTAARKLVGNANRFGLEYLYSFNNNAALIIGADDIRTRGYSQANIIKGGLNLKANVYPFKNFGATNFFVTPFAAVLIATPLKGTSNNGGVGQLTVTGINYEHEFSKHISMDLGAFYMNSVGEGQFSGNWAGVLGGVHYRF